MRVTKKDFEALVECEQRWAAAKVEAKRFRSENARLRKWLRYIPGWLEHGTVAYTKRIVLGPEVAVADCLVDVQVAALRKLLVCALQGTPVPKEPVTVHLEV